MTFGHKVEACWNFEVEAQEEPNFQEVQEEVNKKRRSNIKPKQPRYNWKTKGIAKKDGPTTSTLIVDRRKIDEPANVTISAHVSDANDTFSIYLTIVYAKNGNQNRVELWRDLIQIGSDVEGLVSM
ncbi:hypothetical protein RDI58_020073 [Solanum bulbocastanum]|uniref:Uncharacterized protein n=1 Tax=Solanum bulbocastanum TaxID=147425 RepID=A0AAN8Y7J6_SOLBU